MDKAQLLESCQACTDKILDELRTLVEIETPTGYGEGIEKLQGVLAERFKALGAQVQVLPFEGGANLVATLKGKGTKRLMLLAHADTVFKVGTLAENPYRIENGKVYGPGCIDCKGGIMLGIYALELLQRLGYEDFATITFVVNGDEETGSANSKDLIVEIAKEHDYAIVLEAAKANHGTCIARSGLGQGTITVKGKSCHACRYEQGANALEEIAHQILQFRTLSSREAQTSVSSTICHAGEVANSIPDSATAHVDIRYKTGAEYARVERAAAEFAANPLVPGTEVTFTMKAHPAFSQNPGTDAMAAKLAEVYAEIGETMETVSSPGISDANYIYPVGTPVIDGLSFLGMFAHTNKEEGDVASIASHLYGLTRFLQVL